MGIRNEKKANRILWTGYWFTVPQMLMFFSVAILGTLNLDRMSTARTVNVSMNCFGMVMSLILYISILRSQKFDRTDLLLMVFVNICTMYMWSDAMFWIVDGIPEMWMWNSFVNMCFNLCPIIMISVFWMLLGVLIEGSRAFYRQATLVEVSIAAVYSLFVLLNLPGKFFYSVSPETGLYSRGSLYYLTFAIPTIMYVTAILYILMNKMGFFRKTTLILYPLLPYIDALLRMGDTGPSLLCAEIFCSVFIMYTNLHVQRERELVLRDHALTYTRLQALQMQINPHFIYNTLSSVASLCDSDPMAAQETVYRLSDYLRDNFSDISMPPLISFQEELKHLEHYFSIESMRFSNIRLELDINAEDFVIPRMTLQPLVENAIKHGICKRRGSAGIITVSADETKRSWIICVEDDGVGYEPPKANDGKPHVGLRNVRMRLELLCSGKLEVFRVPYGGTLCRIVMPKEH